MHLVLLLFVGAGAGFVQRVSGFGLGIFAMTFMPHFLPSHTAAATVSTLFSFVTSTYNCIKYRKNVALRTALPMLCAAFVAIPIGVYFSSSVPGKTFEVMLGAVLILLSLYFLFASRRFSIRPTAPNGILAGFLGGALNGLFSTGGPPIVLYLTAATPDKTVYFATVQFYFCVTNIYATVTRAIGGLMNGDILVYALFGIAGCMTGDFFGRFIFDKMDADKFKRAIYVCMMISGVVMLL